MAFGNIMSGHHMHEVAIEMILELFKIQMCQGMCNALMKVSMLSLQVYEILVMETRPGQAISIIECDMQVSPQASLMHGATFVVENRLFIEHRI